MTNRATRTFVLHLQLLLNVFLLSLWMESATSRMGSTPLPYCPVKYSADSSYQTDSAWVMVQRTDPNSGWTTTALGDVRPSLTTLYCRVPFISLTKILLSFTSAQYNFLHTVLEINTRSYYYQLYVQYCHSTKLKHRFKTSPSTFV